MAGVAATQQPEMEDESMRDASLLLSLNGSHLDSAFAYSPGDPMDISPALVADQQHQHQQQQQHVAEQQFSEASSQPVAQPSDPNSNALPRFPFAGDKSSAPGYVKPIDGKASPGVHTRSTIFQHPHFSPKNRASLKQGQLKRLPLAMQAKLPTPMKLPAAKNNFAGGNRNFRPWSTNPHHHNNASSSSASLGFNHPRNFPTQNAPVNRQLFKATDPLSTNTNLVTGVGGATVDQATHQTPAATTVETGQAGAKVPRESTGAPVLQRKRFIEEDNIHHPTTYVSPKYRRISQPISPAQGSQQTAPVKDSSHASISQQPPATSNLISPSKPNIPVNKPRSVFEENKSKPTGGWTDMLELNEAFREQGITPLKDKPPKENTSNQDSLKEHPQPFRYVMPGSWPDDPPDFPESIQEGSYLPEHSPGHSGDHGSLISCALVSPELVSKIQKPVISTLQGSHVSSASPQDANTPQTQGSEVAAEGQSENSSPQPSVSWWDQLHRIYTSSWGATQTVFTTALALADSVKRRAVALFEQRPPAPRRPTTTTSSSPTRANLRTLPEEQRRRLKSNQWRRERGFPTVQDYPFPQLSLDIPQLPASTAPSEPATPKPEMPVNRNRQVRKRDASPVKDTKVKSGVHKRSLVQSLSPNMAKRMQMRPTKRSLARTRLDRSLIHAVQSGKLALDEVPTKRTELVTAARDHTKKQKPRQKREGPKKVRFVLESTPKDPSLVGQHLHPGHITRKEFVEEEKENEPPKLVARKEPQVFDPGLNFWLQSEYPFGRPMSAVRLFGPKKPLPPGRTESIYAAEWRKIEEEEKQKQLPARIRPVGPAVRPLPAKWEARLAEVKSLPESRQIATTLSGDALTKRDLATCYKPMEWLNDEVINAYLALLIDYLRHAHGNAGRHDKPKFHAFNSFFFSNLRDRGYASVSRWARRAKIGGDALLNVDTVYIPVHNSAHWTLMVVKPISRTIEYFDSLGHPSLGHVAKIKDWLHGELSGYDEGEWTVTLCGSPQQNNGSDCGAFLLSTAKAVAVDIEPSSYGAKDIPLLRRKIVAELMSGGLTGEFSPEGETGEVLM